VKLPQRRIQLTLNLSADSWKELEHAWREIEFRFYEHKESLDPIRCTSGGCSSGWHLEVITDSGQDAEGYRRDLSRYMAARKEQP
jgi:hypothetical protein